MPTIAIKAEGREGRVVLVEGGVDVEHPSSKVRSDVVRHFEQAVDLLIPVGDPPEPDRGVESRKVRGIDSPNAFVMRATQLKAETGVAVLWLKSDVA